MTPGTGRPDALLDASDLPYELPRFCDIAVEDYAPGIERAMAEQRQAVAAITQDDSEPTFENTLVPLELSGVRLTRAVRIFKNLCDADSSDQLDAIDAELAPKLAAHNDAILLDPELYDRLQAVAARGEDLDAESHYLLERYLTWFTLAGAALGEDGKQRLKQINSRISELQTQFKIELQADTNDSALLITDVDELAGLGAGEISAAQQAAAERGLTDGYLLTLVLPTAHPYLAQLSHASTRARLSDAQRARGSRGNAHDTRAILLELVRLRAERARLLGFESHAAVVTADSTAKTPEAVRALLTRLAGPAAANAKLEQAQLEAMAGGPVSAADWPFYAEQVRSAEYDIDLAALRPYFEAEKVIHDGVFFCANRLFGLTFTERGDLQGYHPGVRVFEVTEEDGSPVGLYLLDLYTRDSKRGGAWMESLVDAASLTGTVTAVVLNNLNVAQPAPGQPTLLTYEETGTLFHEFGHALHGLLGRSTYPELSGTNVFTDFVEFPSQVNEMWLLWPETLSNFAIHHETGDPIPAEVIERLRAAETFNEGYQTSEYLAAALIDFAWHSLTPEQVPDSVDEIAAFEAATLAAAGLENPAVPSRYGSPYFAHSFTGGYAASYYAYIWAEVLDADTAEWFAANGGLTRENGELYRRHVIGFGGTREPLSAYLEWRGRPAPIEPLLKRRGLLGTGSTG
jgi:peptidyl-dipeptidase Dcp